MEITMILMNMMNKLGRSSDTMPNMYSISMSNKQQEQKVVELSPLELFFYFTHALVNDISDDNYVTTIFDSNFNENLLCFAMFYPLLDLIKNIM
jgi:hypothetical protein